MTPQFLSEKMSRHLSSLVPGFEGHWYWYSEYDIKKGKKKVPRGEPWVMCVEAEAGGDSIGEFTGMRICPAWQVEDVLRNLANILLARKNKRMGISSILKVIVTEFAIAPDTAYQKIEEYLWTVLK